mmetsp:Transcript_8315/g.12317  ORF Transcript_8315/g.12317 Transcript_8315/m.12317 type:complete len:226 (+) Transcript_8315:39-716(+)
MTTTSTLLAPVLVKDDAILQKDSEPFIFPDEYEGHLEGVLISNQQIVERTNELAKAIREHYRSATNHKGIVLLNILKGSSVFCHYLMTALSREKQLYDYDFIRVSSYKGLSTTGDVKIQQMSNLKETLEGNHVIVVEDIVDTGTTLSKLLPQIEREYHPLSVEVCSLLQKRTPAALACRIEPKFVGFSIPHVFAIGFGLDFNQLYRDLLDIWIISEKGIKHNGKF